MKLLSNILIKAGLVVEGAADFQGTTTAVTPLSSDNSNKVATTAFVKAQGNTNIYNSDGTLTGNRNVDTGGYGLYFIGGLNIKSGSQSILFHNAYGSGSLGRNIFVGNGGLQLTSVVNTNYGMNNIGFGVDALYGLTTGGDNIAIGYKSLSSVTSGFRNIAIGTNAGKLLTTSIQSIAIGAEALSAATTAQSNVAVGAFALRYATGDTNTAVGYNALGNQTTGNTNAAFGSQALLSNTTGIQNVAVGGFGALQNNTTGAQNISIGTEALYTNTTSSGNTAVGHRALMFSTAANNVALGTFSAYQNTTGARNTALGYYALGNNTTGSDNLALGYHAGRYIANGTTALTSATQSIYIGSGVKASADTITNEIVIGYGATGNGSNTVTLGNSSITKTYLVGTIYTGLASGIVKSDGTSLSVITDNSANWNTAFGWGNHASAGYALASRLITINGTTYDLSADRSWTISAGLSGSGTSGYIPKFTGSGSIGNSIMNENSSTIFISGGLNVSQGASISGSAGMFPQLTLTADTNTQIRIQAPSSSYTSEILFWAGPTSHYGLVQYNNSSNALLFYANSTEGARLNSNGTFSIGNTNTTYNLDVTGTGRFTGAITASSLLLNGAAASAEGSLMLGAHSAAEGGQLILQKGTGQTYAAHLDNYTDQFRVLYGTNSTSAGIAMQISLSTGQLNLPFYTSTTSFTGTVAGYLAFDSSGKIITTAAPSGGGGSYVPLAGGTMTGTLKIGSGGSLHIIPTSYGSNGFVTFRNTADSATRWNIYNYTGGGTTYGSLNFSTGAGTDMFVINESGTATFSSSVGIATTSPSATLHVVGTQLFDGTGLTLKRTGVLSGQNWNLGIDNSGLSFYDNTNSAYRLVISSSGAVSINGNTALHAGNYSSYALPITGGLITGQVSISTTGLANSPSLRINTSSSASFVHTQENFAANLTAGQRAMIFFGKDGSTKNAGGIGYYWAGAGSNSNFITLGHWGNDDIFRIYGDSSIMTTGVIRTAGVSTNTVYWGAGASSAVFGAALGPSTSDATRVLYLRGGGSSTSLWWGGADGNGTNIPYGAIDATAGEFTFWRNSGGTGGGTWTQIMTMNASGLTINSGTTYIGSNAVLHAGNYNSYSPTLTGGNASGTWGINITGSAASASSATNATNATNATYASNIPTNFLGSGSVNVSNGNSAVYRTDSGNGSAVNYAPVLHISASDTMWQVQGTYGSSGNGTLYFRQGYAGSWGNWLTMISSANIGSQSVNYASSAGALSASASSNNIYNSGWFRNNNVNEGLYNQVTGVHFYSNNGEGFVVTGSGNNVKMEFRSNHQAAIRGYVYADTANNIGFLNSNGNWTFRVNNDGNCYIDYNYGVGIVGIYSASRYQGVWAMGDAYKLAVDGTSTGNLYGLAWSHPNAGGQAGYLSNHGLIHMMYGTAFATISDTIWCRGDITAYSDSRVKENVRVIDNAMDKINAIRGVTFTRTDIEDKEKRFAGVIAQEVLSVLPEVITTNQSNGHYSVSYGNLNALTIEGLKEHDKIIKEQAAEISKLKEKIDELTK